MAQDRVAIQEFSTARGNTLTVLVDLVEGQARPVTPGRPVREAIREAASTSDNLRFATSSAA
jgi:hypothetical protein